MYNIVLGSYSQFIVRLCNFNIGAKAACKMLMKLTRGLDRIKIWSPKLVQQLYILHLDLTQDCEKFFERHQIYIYNFIECNKNRHNLVISIGRDILETKVYNVLKVSMKVDMCDRVWKRKKGDSFFAFQIF